MLSRTLRRAQGSSEAPFVYSFADADAPQETESELGKKLRGHLGRLSAARASRDDVQDSISSMTSTLLPATFEPRQDDDVVLLPILRAGLGMWDASNRFFDSPESEFLFGSKEKGTDRATVSPLKSNDLANKHLVVLEPIIATGDTIVAAHDAILDQNDQFRSLTVLSCYAAPEGVRRITERTRRLNLVVACMARTVDANGYLVPPTNGDIGDKLYGKDIG